MELQRNAASSWKGRREARCHPRCYLAKTEACQKMKFCPEVLKHVCFCVLHTLDRGIWGCEAGGSFPCSVVGQLRPEGAAGGMVTAGAASTGLGLCIVLRKKLQHKLEQWELPILWLLGDFQRASSGLAQSAGRGHSGAVQGLPLCPEPGMRGRGAAGVGVVHGLACK